MADTPPPSPKPAKRERGYANDAPGGFWVDLSNETTPELAWPLSVEVFDKMRRQDSQVSSVLTAVTAPITRTQWRIDGTGCDREVTESVARSLGLPIKDDDPAEDKAAQLRGRDRFSWDEHLRLALLMLPFGHSFFEQVYREDPEATARLGRDQYRIRKLALRPSRTISAISVARDGGLVSIQQYGSGLLSSSTTPPLPVNRLVAYVHEREGANWLGRSLLRSAYKNWLLKDRALRGWSVTIDRNGTGVPVYTAAPGEADLTKGEEFATSFRSGENAGGAIPHDAKLELMGVMGKLPDTAEFVRYQDEAIARSALGHFLSLGSQGGGQVGSYNYGSVLADTFNLSLDVIAGYVAETATGHVVEDLVDINFSPTEPAPRLVYDEIGTRVTELDRAREASGLTSDADLVKFLRNLSTEETE
ncbi:phage portal protein family protein [Nocardioides jensenii]|uniref:phage portal protein family protein n=1 Tax=Nocardioides jensenii TaxID=1843 RepID=UPI000834F0FE|nr:hypothetical protein [Nocardioides jensenii]